MERGKCAIDEGCRIVESKVTKAERQKEKTERQKEKTVVTKERNAF